MEKRNYQIAILQPAGNDQLLVNGIVKKDYRRKINDMMIKKFPNVEQVSFYNFDKKNNTAQLELAGGEFCGNAARSLAYLLLKGKPGKLSLRVSGTNQTLTAGVIKPNTAFAQMPIFSDFKRVQALYADLFRVDLEGITQLICTDSKPRTNEELKQYARQILQEENLLFSVPAAGVMFVEKKKQELLLKPIVWVRDIETLLYETACASGTTAVGLWLSLKKGKKTLTQRIKQPSGQYITVTIKRNKTNFLSAEIDGPVTIIKSKGEISL